MTEAEAQVKYCPLIRMLPTGMVADLSGRDPHCIGSACMMWRVQLHTESPEEEWGYCGLAGKP